MLVAEQQSARLALCCEIKTCKIGRPPGRAHSFDIVFSSALRLTLLQLLQGRCQAGFCRLMLFPSLTLKSFSGFSYCQKHAISEASSPSPSSIRLEMLPPPRAVIVSISSAASSSLLAVLELHAAFVFMPATSHRAVGSPTCTLSKPPVSADSSLSLCASISLHFM